MDFFLPKDSLFFHNKIYQEVFGFTRGGFLYVSIYPCYIVGSTTYIYIRYLYSRLYSIMFSCWFSYLCRYASSSWAKRIIDHLKVLFGIGRFDSIPSNCKVGTTLDIRNRYYTKKMFNSCISMWLAHLNAANKKSRYVSNILIVKLILLINLT